MFGRHDIEVIQNLTFLLYQSQARFRRRATAVPNKHARRSLKPIFCATAVEHAGHANSPVLRGTIDKK